jgi:predicted DNA-binding transcriptional regulator AlpA
VTAPASAELPPILTAPELAALTGYDVSTICRWAKSGQVPAIRKLPGVRGPWLFDPSVRQQIEPR